MQQQQVNSQGSTKAANMMIDQKDAFQSGRSNGDKSSTSNENIPRPGINEGRWTKFEHCSFLKALKLHGRDWKKVARQVGSRTST